MSKIVKGVTGALGLGGGSQGGGTTSAYGALPANIQKLLDQYVSKATNLANSPYQQYPGERIAGLSPQEQQAQGYAQSIFGNTANTINGAVANNQQLAQTAMQGPTSANLQQFMNPYQQNVIDQAKRETVRQNEATQNQIGFEAANNGAFGGSRQALMESENFRNLNNSLTDIQERGSQQGFTNAQDQFFKTLQSGNTLNNSVISGAQNGQNAAYTDITGMTGIGQQNRALDQAGMDVDYQNWLNDSNNPTGQMNILGSALNNIMPFFANYQQQGGGSSGSSGGGLGNLISTGATLFSMFSDKRVKENSKKVGELDNGLPVYSYNYKGDPRTQIGLMAQDVEKTKNKGAVTENEDGIKMVDYDKATQKYAGGGYIKDENKYAGGGILDTVTGALGGTVLGDILKLPGKDGITWDDAQGSAIDKILGSTQGFGSLFSEGADRQDEVDKSNQDLANKVTSNAVSKQWQALISPYANETAQAAALQLMNAKNLFSGGGHVKGYAKGGLAEALDAMRGTTFKDPEGKERTEQGSLLDKLSMLLAGGANEVGDLDLGGGITPGAIIGESGNVTRDISDFLFGVDQGNIEKAAAMKKSPTSMVEQVMQKQAENNGGIPAMSSGDLPIVPGINDGGTTQQSGSQQAFAQMGRTPGIVPEQNQQGAGSDIFTDLLNKIGLNTQQQAPQKINPLMALLAAGTANNGGISSNTKRALAAMYGAKDMNAANESKAAEGGFEKKIEAYKLAADLQDKLNSIEWQKVQREGLQASQANATTNAQARLAAIEGRNNKKKEMTFSERLNAIKALNDPSLDDAQKAQINQILSGVAGAAPSPQGTGFSYVPGKGTVAK